MSEKSKKKLTPFEQNKKNIKDFADNMNLYHSVVLLVEAAKQLGGSPEEHYEPDVLDRMLESTIISFSEFLEERGDSWN